MRLLLMVIVLSLLCDSALATTQKSTKRRPCDPLTGDAVDAGAKELISLISDDA